MDDTLECSDKAGLHVASIAARRRMIRSPRDRPDAGEYLPQPIKAVRADADIACLKEF
ncbi:MULTISPECIES: hypothetical protein [unclassified Bradyrhizobium]|uniref:hypothetical protein n=1 Tax=unclassified Bradyrhizobium TaxID=2631580 RepID=UPI0024E0C2EA|nr:MULTISPECIES: hypothetical protein [unclassified Bradyrhizobium]